MKIVLATVIGIGMLALVGGGAVLAQSGNDLFQQALVKERTDGNIAEAIKLYQTIVQTYGSDRKLAAKALFQIGQAYEKLGNAEARKTYERIAREFGDQKDTAAEARRRLLALGTAPSDTLTARRVLTGASADSVASITPDGRLIAMTDSTGDLAIRDMSTGQVKRLMAKAGASVSWGEWPILSPDLRLVTYTWSGDDTGYIGQLRVMANEPGSKPRVLVNNPEFQYVSPTAWSRDGKSVLVSISRMDRTWQLAWVSLADGSVKMLKSLEWRQPSRLNLSPDGRYIAYSALERSGSLDSSIFVLAADGTSETVLVKSTGVNEAPVWAVDGASILFISNRSGSFGLWSVGVRDGKPSSTPSLVKADTGRISPLGLTRSGSYYYVHMQGGENVLIADLEPGGEKVRSQAVRLSENFVGSNRAPAWSPDGKFIAFKRRPRQQNAAGYELVVHSLETGEEKTYTSNLMMPTQRPLWFKDGRGLVLAMRDNQNRTSFHRVDLQSGEFKQVVAPDFSLTNWAALAPDDKTLYVAARDAEKNIRNIVAIDLSSGQQSRSFVFLPEAGAIFDLDLSPDGRTLAFTRNIFNTGNFTLHLSLIGVDGSGFRDRDVHAAPDPVSLAGSTGFLAGGTISWAKDGRAILFWRDGRLMRFPLEADEPEFVGLTRKGPYDFDLSPDGSRIAFGDGENAIRELWALDNLSSVLKAAR